MRCQSIILALTAASAAAACPTKESSSSAAALSNTANTDSTASEESSASIDTSSSSSATSGTATFYGGNLSGGTCSFTTLSTIPNSLYGTAYSGSAWDSGAECGACVEVTGPNGNTITAMVSNLEISRPSLTPSLADSPQIVDQCPECDSGHLDLFQDAFGEIGDISAGTINISFSFVECGITSPLVLHNKSGTSAYWFSMQVVNANGAVESLEVSADGGSTWQSTTRTEYNFFENSSGFGTDTVSVRVTGASGTTVEVSDVSVASESQTTASANI